MGGKSSKRKMQHAINQQLRESQERERAMHQVSAMGGGGSKGEAAINQQLRESQERERAMHQSHLNQLLEQQKAADMARMESDAQSRREMEDARVRSQQREDEMKREIQLMTDKFNEDSSNRESRSAEERERMRADFNRSVREKEENLNRVREQNDSEMKDLRQKQEDKEKEFRNELSDIQEKRVLQETAHNAQILALSEKAEEVRKTMYEKMLTSQKEASDYLLAQQKAHLDSMTMAYVVMANIPRSIQSDKESQTLEGKKALLRNDVDHISQSYNRLTELYLEDFTQQLNESRKNEAKSMAEMCGRVDFHCTDLVNSLERDSANIDHALRKALITVKAKLKALRDNITRLRTDMMEMSSSIGIRDLDMVRDCLRELEREVDSIPAIQGQSTSELLAMQIQQLSTFDRQNITAILGKSNPAIGMSPASDSPDEKVE
ncbi:hypothetical protein PFISCL1PPCAC_7341, partial [Pristionchus fissidentatus]